MFSTLEVKHFYIKYRPLLIEYIILLNKLNFRGSKEKIKNVEMDLNVFISILRQDCYSDQELNEVYVLGRYLEILYTYSSLWEKIVKGEFSSSWHSLQDSLNLLRIVKKFSNPNISKGISFFEGQLQKLEKLYPYTIFFSIGATVDWFQCSICRKDIGTFDCIHIIGELYRGEMACGIAQNITEVDHISIVKYPSDKRCVVQYNDSGEQFKLVRFLSELITSGKLKPVNFGDLRFSKKKVKNPSFQKMGRNKLCDCGSGKKFKKCCISQEFIDGNHIDIVEKPTKIDDIIA